MKSYLPYGIGLAFAFTWYLLRPEPVLYQLPAGPVISTVPQQTEATASSSWNYGQFSIRPLANFKMEGRVVSSSRYWLDSGASLAPVDLVLAWGPLSDSTILNQLTISQGGRFFFYHYKQPPIEPSIIVSHMANMHMIPSNDEIRSVLKSLERDDLISLSGYLVAASRSDGWHWSSSLSREDSGAGACELIWIDRLERIALIKN